MALTAGARPGRYEILSPLGAGGMGEVYRAADLKLKRQVAVKILPPLLGVDPGALARFQKEAGLEDTGGATARLLELVEGDDLSERIARGPISLDEALSMAR